MEESILMWNRLEGSLSNENQVEKALQFEIRDALWMLTRQWQFGEFDGEDAGTAAFVNFKRQNSPITAVGAAAGPPAEFDYSQSPFEKPVEQEKFLPDLSDRLEMGSQWERLLAKHVAAGKLKSVINAFRTNSRFRFSTGIPEDPDRIHSFQHAGRYGDDSWIQLTQLLSAGRAIDGYALLRELQSGNEASDFLPQPEDSVTRAGKEFLDWFDRIYGQHHGKENTWHPNHLEYQPQLAFNGANGQPRVLKKEEYYGDGIEWHGFGQKNTWNGTEEPSLPPGKPTETFFTVIPAGLRFRGMPAARLWEMEDENVDFGSIQASSTELNKMIFAEFGLVYSNDWLKAPVKLRSGDMCRISGMIVTDIFGKESVLNEIRPDIHWGFFQPAGNENEERWLFMANSTDFIEEGRPFEKVIFYRDEMANIVWGVEEIVADPYGDGRDGETLAKQTVRFVRSLEAPQPDSNIGKQASEGWSYKAGTLMPENRIPFIPVASQPDVSGKRQVMLQRASVPRVAEGFQPVRIRPRTTLLGYGGKPETIRPDPLFIYEEEIPRAGIGLSLVWKRARWFDGRTITWLARNKKPGKGEIDANFRFDMLKK